MTLIIIKAMVTILIILMITMKTMIMRNFFNYRNNTSRIVLVYNKGNKSVVITE